MAWRAGSDRAGGARRRLRRAAVAGIALVAAGCGAEVNPPPGTDRPASAHPALSVSPDHGAAGSTVHVIGLGFVPGRRLVVALCSVDDGGQVADPTAHCDSAGAATVVPDRAGAFTAGYTIVRVPPATRLSYEVVARADPPDPADGAGAPFVVRS